MTLDQAHIDRAFEVLVPLLEERTDLVGEFRASSATFFGGEVRGTDVRETLLAARRHLEWFALERPSPSLQTVPVIGLGAEWTERVGLDETRREQLMRALRDSVTGVFEVTGVQAGEGAWLRDLAGFGEYPVAEAAGAEVLEVGDLIVGRLFPLGEGLFHVSRAAGFYRNPELREALVRDLARARDAGGGKVLHVAQLDLESMFWQRPRSERPDAGDPAEEVRDLLRDAGYSRARVDELLERLAHVPFDPARLLHGVGDVMGELLNELAFETNIDLERARRLLVRVWSRRARVLGPAGAPPQGEAEDDEVDPRAALEAFERGRAAGADLDTLFRALQEDLGIADDEDEDEAPAPDFPGVIGAMVEEFLWEMGLAEGQAAAERHRVLRRLGRFGAHIGAFEDLSATDLLHFTSFWLLEERELSGAREARALISSLRAFCTWAEKAHELPLEREFGQTLDGLEESLPRAVEANRSLGRAARDLGDTGELLTYLGERDGERRVRDRHGDERTVSMAEPLLRWLRPGDPLRGRVQIDDSLSVFCCYPPQAAGLVVR